MEKGQKYLLLRRSLLLCLYLLPGCTSGIVAVSKDTLTIYERAGERLKSNQAVLQTGVVPELTGTATLSREIQLTWEQAIEVASVEQEYAERIQSAGSTDEKQQLRQAAVLRVGALEDQYRARTKAAGVEVQQEMAELLASHQQLVTLNEELLKNQQEIHRCLNFSWTETLAQAIRFNFSPAKSQCFIDINRTKALIKQSKELLDELKELREKNMKTAG
jgi:hypothetical protein